MLRTPLRSARLLGGRPMVATAARQWPSAASTRQAALLSKRGYADQKKPEGDIPKPIVLPTTETKTSERSASIPSIGNESNPPTIEKLPQTPPTPNEVMDEKPAAHAIPASPPPPPKKGFFRRLRNFVFTLMVLGAVGFSGGVWYSRVNDNFHDFFVEYVPFGEPVVLFLEEREFRKRFPQNPQSQPRHNTNEQVKLIPAQSGASWRVATSDPNPRQSIASSKESAAKKATLAPPKEEPKSKAAPVSSKSKPAASAAAAAPAKAPEVNEPSRAAPLKPIDLLDLEKAREPVIQDLVHMVNDLILVINADGAHGKYGSTINKAKNDIVKVGGKLDALRAEIEKQSAAEVREKVAEFDKAATDLVSRVEKAMINQELDWRQEFETEMKKVRESYDGRVKLLLEREEKLQAEKLQNQLLEQAIALKKEFVQGVQDQVEKEREGRLGKLQQLSTAVSDLEKLSTGWDKVVDSTLRTQQLQVAVDCVRAKLAEAESSTGAQQPTPFIKELVALKEIAGDNATVNAAIGSVNPAAYQRGIPSSAQLIDRFRRVAQEVRKASLLPNDAGVASHASSWVLSQVMFKKEGLAEGDDVESILTRAHTFLEEGDLDNAAREVNSLDGWAKTLSKDWLAEVRKVLEVRQALDVISTEARLQNLRVE
ncbi:mitofilin [Geosmithia morbida]|uniref:MICOS complex subunit MIC60 n=1 Tax=Geosmithia morbida TaxID=1094350 RepID=A0A9P4Z0B5_9HYPO|nr:mitofilin [Geosmithia morbida]KAF4125079.1 mitofilin [Geosmithia morbida]